MHTVYFSQTEHVKAKTCQGTSHSTSAELSASDYFFMLVCHHWESFEPPERQHRPALPTWQWSKDKTSCHEGSQTNSWTWQFLFPQLQVFCPWHLFTDSQSRTVCSVDRMGTPSSAVTNWGGGGLPRGRFLTSFGSWNLLDSDENTPFRNTYRPTLSHTIARWWWGEVQ